MLPPQSFNANLLLLYTFSFSFFFFFFSTTISVAQSNNGHQMYAQNNNDVSDQPRQQLARLALRHISSMPSHSHLSRSALIQELRHSDEARFHTMVSSRLKFFRASMATTSMSSSSSSSSPSPSSPSPSSSSSSSSSSPASGLQTAVTSGASVGAGQYFVEFALGTPPQKLKLIADTGSDLIWARCSLCKTSCSGPSPSPSNNNDTSSGSSATTFIARASSTYRPIPCLSQDCLLVPAPPNFSCNIRIPGGTTCSYDYSYSDTSESIGIFSRDSVSLGFSSASSPLGGGNSSTKPPPSSSSSDDGGLVKVLPGIAFGCGLHNRGQSFVGSDGVLGLGRGPISLVTQVGTEFSYCLVDFFKLPARESYLTIGGSSAALPLLPNASSLSLQYTPMVQNPFAQTPYYIGIEGVRVDGKLLSIPAEVWRIDPAGNGGTILDSGTTLSAFLQPAYDPILAAMSESLTVSKLPRLAPPAQGFDICVNATGIEQDVLSERLPKLSIAMSGGATFEPPPNGNVFISVDPSGEIKCLGIRGIQSTIGFSVLGNLIQQNFMFVFDNQNSRLGFAGPTDCHS